MNRWLGGKRAPESGEDEPMTFDLASSLEAAEREYAPPREVNAPALIEQPYTAAPAAEPEGPAATYFDSSTELQGSLKCKGNVGIDGKFEGDVHSDAFVVIGHQAEVRADISAESVIVAGHVQGNIRAASSVEIQAGGSVVGNLTTNELHIDSGGVLKGQTFTGAEPDIPEPASRSRSSSRAKRAEREAPAANGSEAE